MKKKNVIGALIMAGAVLVSVPLGVNRSFDRLWQDVKDEYYYDATGGAVWEYAGTQIDTARNLLTVAERYVDQNPELRPYMDELEHWTDLFDNNMVNDPEDINQEVKYNHCMGEAAQALADCLETVKLTEKDEKYPAQLIADLESEQDKIERSSFNDEAIAYNEKRERFPASVLAPLCGVEEIVPFGAGSGLESDSPGQ